MLNEHDVAYLLVGGYAVGYHGYVRATADMDIWVEPTVENARRVTAAFREFGFDVPGLEPKLFLEKNKIVRIGQPPVRIEVMSSISGVVFKECYEKRTQADWDDLIVPIISLACLKQNKRASGRLKDLADLEYL
ncbi:MAG: hypothetical protein SH809_20290 [Rhodothermales bacterium]|nr:hypothetical protein [Rhodothermales bacterium]